MTVDLESRSEPLLPSLIEALAGLPIGLWTATMEYGLAAVACVASTAAELHNVYRSRVPGPPVQQGRSHKADVIPLRGGGATGPRT